MINITFTTKTVLFRSETTYNSGYWKYITRCKWTCSSWNGKFSRNQIRKGNRISGTYWNEGRTRCLPSDWVLHPRILLIGITNYCILMIETVFKRICIWATANTTTTKYGILTYITINNISTSKRNSRLQLRKIKELI